MRDGYELALAAALGGRLSAALVKDVAGAEALLDRAGPDGGSALLADIEARGWARGAAGGAAANEGEPPVAGAERLLDLVSGRRGHGAGRAAAGGCLGGRALGGSPSELHRYRRHAQGPVWFAAWGEVRQLTEGGAERVLARRNERDRLIAASELAAAGRASRAVRDSEQVLEEVRAAEEARAQGRSGAARGRARHAPRGARRTTDRVADRAAKGGARGGAAGRAQSAAGG